MENKKSTVLLPVRILVYFFLGCYYTLYGLLYPFIFVFKKIGDFIFSIYRKKEKTQIKIEDIAPDEAVNLDTGESEAANSGEALPSKEEDTNVKKAPPKGLEEQWKEFYNNLSFVKKAKAKQLEQNQILYESLQTDTTRSEVPVTFKYTALDANGKKQVNTFYAFSKMEVYTFLTNEGYTVLKIETSKLIESLYGPSPFNTYHFKNKDLIFWLTQLSTYLKAGIPLTDAMRVLSKQMSKSAKKKRVFDSIIYNLTLGEAFSSALEKQHESFPALLISMIKTAEATGELEATLDDMANYYTEIENTRKAMINAMTYPAIITVFSLAVIVFIILYVIPQFEKVYASAGATLNGFTLFIISFSKFLDTNFYLLLGIIVGSIVLLIVLYKKVKAFRKGMQIFAMHIPIFGKIIIYKEMSVFAKTFASLLKNNVFITESMNLLSDITNNEVYKEIMFTTINNIAKGDKISESFKNQWAVPEVAYYMIVTGESTGELAQMMG
jgi:type IV pilus assembly protein PilC